VRAVYLAFDFAALSESASRPSVDSGQFVSSELAQTRNTVFLHASPYRPNVRLRNATLELTFFCSLASLKRERVRQKRHASPPDAPP
jgi:hypothetical protein